MKLTHIATLWCLSFIAPLIVHGQTYSAALLAVRCEAVDHVCERQSLMRYRFQNGVLTSTELILTTDTNRVRYDLGDNYIYRNRFVITNWGDVVDIETKQLLHDGDGEYVATDGDRIIQHVNKIDNQGYYYYDLKLKQYRRIRGPNKWALPGLLSPDQHKSVEADGSDIWLHRLGQEKKLLGKGFTVQNDLYTSSFPRAPLFWLDNDRVLTQRRNGEVVVLQLDGTVTLLVKIPITKDESGEPFFFRDPDGRVIYACSGESFVINVEQKSYATHQWSSRGFGFDAENDRNPAYGHVIRYQQKEIGRLWALVRSAPATDGYIAFLYGDVGSNLGYPKGIQVWTGVNHAWTTINEKWIDTIIGWVKE